MSYSDTPKHMKPNKALQPTPIRFAPRGCADPLPAVGHHYPQIARSGWLSLTFGQIFMSRRHFLFPLVWGLYYKESIHDRGQYLIPLKFEAADDNSLSIYYGLFEGFRSGHVAFTANPPTIEVHRKDGVSFAVDFQEDESAILSLRKDGVLVVYRSGESPFQICIIRSFYAVQMISIFHGWPDNMKQRFRIL